MASQITLLCLLGILLSAGCYRGDMAPGAKETGAQKPADPAVDHPRGDHLARPVAVEVEGKPLVRDGDGLVPFVGDLDGDGRLALLLGTRGRAGRLLIYRNIGTRASPRLSGPQWFDDTVPTGRIPKG